MKGGQLLISLSSIFSEARSLQYAKSDDNISKISGNNNIRVNLIKERLLFFGFWLS